MKKITVIFILMMTLAGCATIFSSGSSLVKFDASDLRTNVKIVDDEDIVLYNGPVPVSLNLSHSNMILTPAKYKVFFSTPDGKKAFKYLTASFNPLTLFNILGPTVFGLAIDAVSGAIFRINDKFVFGDMEFEEFASVTLDGVKVKLYDKSEFPAEVQEQMVRVR